MSDVYVEDPEPEAPTAVERLRAEVERTIDSVHKARSAIVRAAHDARDRVAREARSRARFVNRSIQSRLGMAALIAVGTGVALGLLAAILSDRRGRK